MSTWPCVMADGEEVMRWKISTATVYGYKTDTKCAHSVRGRPTKKWPPGRKAYLVKLGLKSFVDGRQGICKDKESNLGSVVGY